jgi:hypothetical protein
MSTENQNPVLPENFTTAKALVDSAYVDAVKFYSKGNVSAAARTRKAFSSLAKLAKEVRKDIQVAKKAKVAERKAKKTSQE